MSQILLDGMSRVALAKWLRNRARPFFIDRTTWALLTKGKLVAVSFKTLREISDLHGCGWMEVIKYPHRKEETIEYLLLTAEL